MRLVAITLILVLVVWGTPAGALQSHTSHTHKMLVEGSEATITYCANGSISDPDPATEHVVIVVHGTNRNACDYARFVGAAAELAGIDRLLIVAPKFASADDPESMSSQALAWDDFRWKVGGLSLDDGGRPPQVSSFAVIDHMVADLIAQPNLDRLGSITVAGHSAGGQFVQRYAATTEAHISAAAEAVTMSFVVANPGSYLYLDDRRLRSTRFEPLTETEDAACPNHNRYRYGLEGLDRSDDAYRYVRLRADSSFERYRRVRVDYLLGALDNDPHSPLLDVSCEAGWQGSHRLERGLIFERWLIDAFGSAITGHHRVVTVQDVGHSPSSLFASPKGQVSLFGSKLAGDATCDGELSFADVMAVLHVLAGAGSGPWWCGDLADIDMDGDVTLADALRMAVRVHQGRG